VMASASSRYGHRKSCGGNVVRHIENAHDVVFPEGQPKTLILPPSFSTYFRTASTRFSGRLTTAAQADALYESCSR
jgi:hypothetical protein